MERIFNKIKTHLLSLLLIFTTGFLCWQNYQPGTWLSGWDTLHPEFNFSLYFQRIFTVWQSHQGLGAPPSQAHAAEIPRMFVYYPLSFILPTSFLRYSYFFLTLILGPLGVYYFILKNCGSFIDFFVIHLPDISIYLPIQFLSFNQ